MGCTASSEKSAASVDIKAMAPKAINTGSKQQQKTPVPVATNSVQVESRRVVSSYAHEDKIELIFKSKRANVFSAGLVGTERSDFQPKVIQKTNTEAALIRKCSCSHNCCLSTAE